jgi:hypothetical protein
VFVLILFLFIGLQHKTAPLLAEFHLRKNNVYLVWRYPTPVRSGLPDWWNWHVTISTLYHWMWKGPWWQTLQSFLVTTAWLRPSPAEALHVEHSAILSSSQAHGSLTKKNSIFLCIAGLKEISTSLFRSTYSNTCNKHTIFNSVLAKAPILQTGFR